MRVTQNMYYDNIYATNNSQLNTKLFDVNKQIASTLNIQYANEDIAAFTETMRLDNEITTLNQVQSSTESGYKVSNQSDVLLNEFTGTMGRMRVLMLSAANGTHSEASLDAISDELRVMEDHLINLSNTSINGQYLFSGTAVNTRPISPDGTYNGNDGSMNSFLGSNVQQQYNISGSELFLGQEVDTKREIVSNVTQSNLSEKYDFSTQEDNGSVSTPITEDDTIRDLMGDTNSTPDTLDKHHFYLSGTKSDGTAFTEKFVMKDEDTIDSLLNKIGDTYGNTPAVDVVNVSLNKAGQIVIEDKLSGSSKLDFHLVGATDYVNGGTGGDTANVTDLTLLDSGSSDYVTAASSASGLFVKEFLQSGLSPAAGAATNIEGLVYDKTQFSKDGALLSSSSPQVLKSYNYSVTPPTVLDKNAFATDSTLVSDVADITNGTPFNFADDTLDGNVLDLSGTTVDGVAYTASINFLDAGSTFTVGANTYDMFNVDGTPVSADKMTYRQMMDVVNMVVTDELPTLGTPTDYYDTIKDSTYRAQTTLSFDGKVEFKELGVTDTKASISLYDTNSGDFTTSTGSVLTFNSNNGLTIRDPKTDFFAEINEMITAVENHKDYPDSSSGDMRNVGIESSIQKIDDLLEHVSKSHSKVGAQSNALNASLERTSLLEVSTKSLRSSVIDTDIAEAALTLTQLSLNYEAMLSTVSKVSKLSLVNYL